MARRSSFLQGMGEHGNDDEPTPPGSNSLDNLLYSPPGSTLGGPNPWDRTTPPPGPPREPEYNPLAGLLDPNLPAYAQPGAQPARQPGDASYLSEMFAGNNGNTGNNDDDDLPAPGSQAEYELMQEGFGNDPYPPGEDFRQHLNQADPRPGYIEHAQATADAIRNDPNFSPAPPPSDFGGGEFEEEEEDDGGFWNTLNDAGEWAIDAVSNLNPIRPPVLRPGGSGGLYNANPPQAPEDMPLTGTVIRTTQDLATLAQLGGTLVNTAVTNPTQIARNLGAAAQAIEEDPSVIVRRGQEVGGQMWQDFLEHPEDAAIGAALTAATGGAFAGTRATIGALRGTRTVLSHADEAADVAQAANAVVRPTATAAAGNVAQDVASPAINVAADAVDASRVANAATGAAEALPGATTRNVDAATSAIPQTPQYQLPSVSPSAAPSPTAATPQYQLPAAQMADNVADAAEAAAPAARQFDVLSSAPTPRNTPFDVLSSAPTRQVADVAEDVADVSRALPSRLSVEQMARAGEDVADVGEDVADVGEDIGFWGRNDLRLSRGVERRLQRRSNLQPTNIARRIVGADQKDLRYSRMQQRMNRIGDRIAGGPGAEGSPNALRQYIAQRVRRSETMPEFPEGTNRGLQAYERAAWRYGEGTRPLRRAENAVGAASNTVENIHDAAEFVRNPWSAVDMDEPIGGSIYGDEEVITASPRSWRRPTNPRFAAATPQAPASQAYGQSPYVAGRGYRSE